MAGVRSRRLELLAPALPLLINYARLTMEGWGVQEIYVYFNAFLFIYRSSDK